MFKKTRPTVRVSMRNANKIGNVTRVDLIRMPSRPVVQGPKLQTIPVGSLRRLQDQEHLLIDRVIQFTSSSNAGRTNCIALHTDIGANILPTGSRYVDENYRFNTSMASVILSCTGDKPYHVAVVLHVRDSTAQPLQNPEINTSSTTQTLEELYEAELPAGEHDFAFLTPWISSKILGYDSSDLACYIQSVNVSLDINSTFDKINAEYWSNAQEADIYRAYDIVALFYTPYASTSIQGSTPLIVRGTRVLAKNRLL